jgi:DNA-binding MarR family transcriptional regulator
MTRMKRSKLLVAEILRTAHRLTLAREALLRGSGITPAQLRLLKTIRRLPVPFTISALARAMDVSRQAARVTVHELAAIGLVSLGPDRRDTKAKIIVLTSAGRTRLEIIQHVEQRWVSDLMEGFDDRSLAHAAWLIGIVRERALERRSSRPSARLC